MNTQQLKQASGDAAWKMVLAMIDFLKITAATITAAGVVAGAALWVMSPRLDPYIQLPTSVSILKDSVTGIADDVTEQAERLGRIERRVDVALRPAVADWDAFRSRVVGGACTRDDICTAEVWVRRTEEGSGCDAPQIARYVRDGSGDVIAARNPFPAQPPTRAGDDWLVIENKFLVPQIAKPGEAVYFMELKYANCPFADEGEMVEESSPAMAFVLR